MNKLKEFHDLYSASLNNFLPSAPGGYSELISTFLDKVEAETTENNNLYKTMFIISPADVTDSEKVKQQLIRASKLPVSIVFVECAKEPLPTLGTIVNQGPFEDKVWGD